MLVVGDSTTWMAVGTSAFAALVMLLALGALLAWRRSSSRQLRNVHDSATRTEALVVELTERLDAVRAESDTAREVGERAEREARRLRAVSEVASLLDLDGVAQRMLEEAAGATDGSARWRSSGGGSSASPVTTWSASSRRWRRPSPRHSRGRAGSRRHAGWPTSTR